MISLRNRIIQNKSAAYQLRLISELSRRKKGKKSQTHSFNGIFWAQGGGLIFNHFFHLAVKVVTKRKKTAPRAFKRQGLFKAIIYSPSSFSSFY